VGAEPGVVKLKDGSVLETGTFIWTADITGCAFAESLDLAKGPFGKNLEDSGGGPPKRNRRGRLLVTDEIRSADQPDVFPVGDNLWFIENEKPLPQIVETAVQTGETAAHNIIADIEGQEAKKFKSNYHGFMVSVGGRYAVSNALGIKLSGFFAMAMKHIVNLHYLIGVAGFNQCWEYIKHEFLDMRQGRSFIRSFGAYKTKGYWLLPLRLWLGLMWVFEGINKIGGGWLS
jgi:NADH dehydrogenase